MRQRGKRTLAWTLALWVALSALPWQVSAHFCGGALQSMAFFAPAEPCPLEQAPSCPNHPEKRKDCCSDAAFQLDPADYEQAFPQHHPAPPAIAVLPAPAWAAPAFASSPLLPLTLRPRCPALASLPPPKQPQQAILQVFRL